MKMIISLAFLLCLFSCTDVDNQNPTAPASQIRQNPTGNTIKTRFVPPAGYTRISVSAGSFAEYLQNLPLQPPGAKVHYYDGREKPAEVHAAVLTVDVGNRDLQQCADAVMRLRAEHLYAQKRFDEIHFNFVSGDRIDYNKWRKGYRVRVKGNDVSWVKTAQPSDDYKTFRKYLDLIYAYAGTLSLAKELKPVSIADIKIGDVFIQGGSPGHAVIVADMAEQTETGKKVFLLAQSYMPAQEIHVLKNPVSAESPWYGTPDGKMLKTPEWSFRNSDLKRFE